MANAKWVVPRILGYVSEHLNCKPSTIQSRMKRKYKVEISYWTAWHARHICLEKVYGSFEDNYTCVPELCRQIQLANSGSVATWSKEEGVAEQFGGLFVMYKASLYGSLRRGTTYA
ncbi:hypothetical protein MKW94_005357 [Papaver nudicaule]|uniref:Uncharacterized protein n=1 Tax=Papaver nudicaule TaxID=74823 RepID=A0AA41RWG3_PAPNU|nr:hypothetical protein [Papaver nudicaule]